MSNNAADNMSSGVEQPTAKLSPDMPNDPVVQSNKDLALNEQPDGAAVESKSNDVQQAKNDLVAMGTSSEPVQARIVLFLDELTKGVNETVVVMVCRSWDVHAVTRRYLSTDFVLSDAKVSPYLADVSGYVTNVGRTTHQRTGSQTLDFYLTNDSSSTQILDDPHIPALKEFKKGISDGEGALNQVTLNVDHSQPKDGTFEYLLIWARNRKNDSSTFNCKVKIDNVRTRKGWNYRSCGGFKCKKDIDRKAGSFWCDSCNKPVEYPVLR
uniref:Replication factor A C-terminal domain-containing protein n=1 Tax=Tanacetum cinerariifolium TaxID=118510 RepID=A0A699HIN8_TANCI|nr:hypothetical protein [Tanacetum cinerariifolium]